MIRYFVDLLKLFWSRIKPYSLLLLIFIYAFAIVFGYCACFELGASAYQAFPEVLDDTHYAVFAFGLFVHSFFWMLFCTWDFFVFCKKNFKKFICVWSEIRNRWRGSPPKEAPMATQHDDKSMDQDLDA